MTKLFAVLVLAAGAVAQQINTTALATLAANLTAGGFTELVSLVQSVVDTQHGKEFLSIVSNSTGNFTIFAPTNDAIKNYKGSKDPEKLAAVLSYHIVPGYFANTTAFFSSPNTTVLKTFLNSTDYVHLQGNSSQVLVASEKNGTVFVANGGQQVTVDHISASDRLSILQVNSVLLPPGDLASVAKQAKLSLFATAVEQAKLLDPVVNAHGLTIFAPTDAALTKALGTLGPQAQNTSLIQTILQNHIINGTTVYTTQLDDANYTSAAGEALNFYVYNNTITVYSGSNNTIKANITQRDVLYSNGVIHVIDAVLANSERDDNAASSAYSSATSAAASSASATPTPTGSGGVGGNPPGGPNGDNAAGRVSAQWVVGVVAAVAGVAIVAL